MGNDKYKTTRHWLLVLLLFGWMMGGASSSATAQMQLGDFVNVQDARSQQLIGYGLVTGLDRTGDRTIGSRGSVFTVRSIANMLSQFGISVDSERLRTRNVAAVMVTATIGPYHVPGSEINVTVSSLGDASSLEGGVLLQTPLINPANEEVYAIAQGPLVVGGISAEIPGASISRNENLTATIPGGGLVKQAETFTPNTNEPLGLILREPSYINARRVVEAINSNFGEELAFIYNPGLVRVRWPQEFGEPGMSSLFISTVLQQEIVVDTPARVVINERTGTIVAGGDISIGEALISHGSVQVRTQVTPFISQPPPLSGGETVVVPVPQVAISEEAAQNILLEPDTNVQELASALTSLGLSPRDIISIFQALNRAGALRAELVVM